LPVRSKSRQPGWCSQAESLQRFPGGFVVSYPEHFRGLSGGRDPQFSLSLFFLSNPGRPGACWITPGETGPDPEFFLHVSLEVLYNPWAYFAESPERCITACGIAGNRVFPEPGTRVPGGFSNCQPAGSNLHQCQDDPVPAHLPCRDGDRIPRGDLPSPGSPDLALRVPGALGLFALWAVAVL